MVDGILNLPWWGVVLAALLMTHVTIAGVTIFLHRYQAHRSLELHPIVSHFFRLWLWLSTGMVTKAWTAVHRKHHAKCETEDDPHSPQVLGIRKVFWEGAELYRKEAKNQETLDKYGHGTPDDWLERNIYTRSSKLGIGLMLAINLLLFGIAGISVWGVQMIWIPIFAAGVVNGIGHFWGYRNYETQDAARNISPWGIIIGGEELHNNHHAFPGSAKLSSKPWEFDIGWMYIRIFEMLGLAKVKKVAPEPVIVEGKQKVDMETVRAIVVHRLHVLSHYYRDVMIPVLKEEVSRGDAAWSRVAKRNKALLVRDEALIDEISKDQLQDVLKHSQSLNTVYEFKLRLQELWKRSSETQEHMLYAVQEWCRQAEATGNQYLKNFAITLRGYTVQANPA